MRLAGRRRQQVGAAHDLVDALVRVVDDDGEVVGGDAVVAAEDDVVDESLDATVQAVHDRHGRHLGVEPERRGSTVGGSTCALRAGEPQAGAGIGPLGSLAVGSAARLEDLPPGAGALVGEPGGLEGGEGVAVQVEASRLAHRGVVGPEAQRVEVAALRRLVVGVAGTLVEVLDAHDEPTARRAGEEPGEQARPQVAQVERARRTRREASVSQRRGLDRAGSRSAGSPSGSSSDRPTATRGPEGRRTGRRRGCRR